MPAKRPGAGAEGADAGKHDPRGRQGGLGAVDEAGVGPDVQQCFLGRAEIADAVVEDRDHRGLQDALGRRDGRALDPDGVAQGPADGLEVRFEDVVGVAPVAQLDVQGDGRRVGKGAPELLG